MKKTIAIVGGGPAALFLAANLDENQYHVTIYEKNAALGRKFLVAGQGGFNLTHSEDIEMMLTRYTPTSFLKKALKDFSNTDLRNFLNSLGIQTYVGTSKRVFPVKDIKPISVFNALLNFLKQKGVIIKTNFNWKGFDADNKFVFETETKEQKVVADKVIFALGGASWKVTGSDGSWLGHFEKKGITCLPFRASNSAFEIKWPEGVSEKFKGKALKNCSFLCGEKEIKGEAVLTSFGIEGSGVYPLSGEIRKQLDENKSADLFIDFKPQLTKAEIKKRLVANKNKALSRFLETDLKLNKTILLLLKTFLSKEEFTDPETLSSKIKEFKLIINSLAPIDEAISTVGGIALNEIDENYELKKLPQHYVIGEMLDWDAPTGGYLLQACFSMGHHLAKHLNTI
ncbi:MAG: NAD(P)-dependent oxidoreductase [Bacteroidia bacterium]|nr:NAD(P)-dependent oxidoreductase [Bacteroidia bacterium]